jgi:hypothetical protein
MGLPPSFVGAAHVTAIDDALVALSAAVMAVGAPGTFRSVGVMTFTLGLDAGLLPTELNAATSTKYSVPGFSPSIVHDVADAD